MIVKMRKNQIGQQGSLNRYRFHPTPAKWMESVDNKLTLSIKVGKRRKLVNGWVDMNYEYNQYTGCYYEDWFFIPKNPEKLERILNAH